MDLLEEGNELTLDFEKLLKIGKAEQQVIPVVLQDADSLRSVVRRIRE